MEDLLINMMGSLMNSTTTHEPSVVETVLVEIRAVSLSQVGGIVILHLEQHDEEVVSGSASRCATLMISSGFRQLCIDLGRLDPIPNCLRAFMADPHLRIAVTNADAVIGKLRREYGLVCDRFVDMGSFAADYFGEPGLQTAGMEELGRRVVRDYCSRGDRRRRGQREPNN